MEKLHLLRRLLKRFGIQFLAAVVQPLLAAVVAVAPSKAAASPATPPAKAAPTVAAKAAK